MGIGETCGAVVGAMIVLGLKFGHCDTEHMEQKDIMNAKRAEFLTKFQEKYGVCSCKGLLKHDIADPEGMQKILEEGLLFDFCPEIVRDTIKDFHELTEIPVFQEMVPDKKYMDTEEHLDVLQMNIGRKCNLLCKHCHVNAGPARTEEMSKEVMDACLTFAKEQNIATIDITGGAPEMNPHLEYLIEESSRICNHVIIRTNLVILLEEEYEQLMEVYAKNKVEIVCSLPYYRAAEMDKVRGEGSFDKAIEVIKHLNAIGYGRNPELVLNMVYNPAGAFFPPDQEAMEKEYKQKLSQDFGIEFNSLYTLYNNPMGRFGAFLQRSGNLKRYMKKLFDAFNADTVGALMCRTQISVDYDGQLYDCDFNLAAGIPVVGNQKIFDVTGKPYQVRKIRMDKHCYACTAGAGSS